MTYRHAWPATRRTAAAFAVLCWLAMLIGTAACGKSASRPASPVDAVLRVGVGGLSQQAPQAGLRQIVSNLSVEGLVNHNEDGRPRPWIAESWVTAPDGLSLTVQLRAQAKFHDGSPVTAADVVPILQSS